MGVGYLLFSFLISGINDVHEGDCLTINQIQNIVGVEDANIYVAGDCKPEPYLLAFKTNPDACSTADQQNFLDWKRSLIDHEPPGFGSSNCWTSVTDANYSHSVHKKISPTNACFDNNDYISLKQTETLLTKEFGVGIGKIYLPDPLDVVHEEDSWTQAQGLQLSVWTHAILNMKYLGWGKFEATWKKFSHPAEEKPTECKIAKLKPSKDDQNNDCILITKLTDCPD